MRLLLVFLAACATADAETTNDEACLPKSIEDGCVDISIAADGDDAIVCYDTRCDTVPTTCLVVAPDTGRVIRSHPTVPSPPVLTEEPAIDLDVVLRRCGKRCAKLRTHLSKRQTPLVAVDPSGKRLFDIDVDYPTRGSTWDIVTGERLARFQMDDFDGPPPPVSFDRVEWIGRHVFVGDQDNDYVLTYDAFHGDDGLLFQSRRVGTTAMVVEIDGFGRVDLRDYAERKAPLVATRRVRPQSKDHGTMIAKTLTIGTTKALVAIQDPPVTVLVDATKRSVSRVRPLPRCE